MKKRKINWEEICSIIGLAIILCCIVYFAHSKNISDKQNANINEVTTVAETYTVNSISLETKKVNKIEYQILNIGYYDSEQNKDIKKSILVDLEQGCCLWNSDDQIELLNNNEESYSIYDNGLTINDCNENTITIVRGYYKSDSEMSFLTVQINLTEIPYESLGI